MHFYTTVDRQLIWDRSWIIPKLLTTLLWFIQSGDADPRGGGGHVAHLQSSASGWQPESLHHQVLQPPCVLARPRSELRALISAWFHRFYNPARVLNRKVQTESSTGSVGSSRVRTMLTVCVETIDFDSQACQLRVKGTNIEENQYVKVWSRVSKLMAPRTIQTCENVLQTTRDRIQMCPFSTLLYFFLQFSYCL